MSRFAGRLHLPEREVRMTSRLTCLLWGHAVDNQVFLEVGRACTRCGRRVRHDDPAPVRIGHTLSCFVTHHTYEPVGTRDGHMGVVRPPAGSVQRIRVRDLRPPVPVRASASPACRRMTLAFNHEERQAGNWTLQEREE